METTSKYPKPVKETRKVKDPTVGAFRIMEEAVRSELLNCELGDEFETLVQTLQHNIQGMQQVKDDVLEAFQDYYSGKLEADKLHVFGSSVMGIAFKDSDLDFYIQLPNFEQSKAAKKDRTEMVRRILENSQKFARFELITRPRIPIIRCVHIATLTKCDFNCTNGLGTLNSPIIAHLLKFDPRIHPLAIIIKYWMKVHGCAGKKRISNYAAVWMLIYYLQTLPQPIVPPISEFQLNVPRSMYAHYNFAFDYSLQNKTENQSQLPELLLGFFKFYRDFDYTSQVICPLHGKTLLKKDVAEKKGVELERYKEILLTNRNELPMWLDKYALCIQDPFEIIRKIPGEILPDVHRKIVWKIGYAAGIIECELQKGDIKSMFSQLFDVDKFEQYVNLKEKPQEPETIEAERNIYLPITTVFSKNARDGNITMQLFPTNFILKMSQWTISTNNSTATMDGYSTRKRWAKEVTEMVVDILNNIFKLEAHDDDHHDDKFEKIFGLSGARNVFSKRKPKYICSETWNDEVLDSSKRFGQTTDIPLELTATITADAKHFDYLSIEFSDKINSEEDNFYRTFCQQFIDRIDYFLQVYFVHRNEKAAIVNEKLTSSVAEPATHRKSKSERKSALKKLMALKTTPIHPPIAHSSNTTFKLYPLDFAQSIARNILVHNEKRNGNEGTKKKKRSIQQLWTEEIMKMIVELLSDIFKLELNNQTSSTHQFTFDLTGLCDQSNRIFSARKRMKKVGEDTWIEEKQHSTVRFHSTLFPCYVPFKLSATITADTDQFDWVLIEFHDQIRTRKKNFYTTFCNEFVSRINYYQHIYFAHRNKEITSASLEETNVNVHPAITKPATESAMQQVSTSTLLIADCFTK